MTATHLIDPTTLRLNDEFVPGAPDTPTAEACKVTEIKFARTYVHIGTDTRDRPVRWPIDKPISVAWAAGDDRTVPAVERTPEGGERILRTGRPGVTLPEFSAVPKGIYEAVIAVLGDLKAIEKTGVADASMGGYQFRRIEDVTGALRPLLAKHGVFVTPTTVDRRDTMRTTIGGKGMYCVDLLTRFTFYDYNGSSFSSEMWGTGVDTGDKAVQKAVTAAFKSLLTVTFCISDAGDDAEAHVIEETEPPPPEPDPLQTPEHKERVRALAERAAASPIAETIKAGFTWPWTPAACAVIETLLDREAQRQTPAPASEEPAGIQDTGDVGLFGVCEVCGLPLTDENDDCPGEHAL